MLRPDFRDTRAVSLQSLTPAGIDGPGALDALLQGKPETLDALLQVIAEHPHVLTSID